MFAAARFLTVEKQDKQAEYYNKKHRDVEYAVGQLVWHRNFAVSDKFEKITASLLPRYVGPFVIVKRVGRTMYTLAQENDSSKLVGCYHASDLRPVIREEPSTSVEPPCVAISSPCPARSEPDDARPESPMVAPPSIANERNEQSDDDSGNSDDADDGGADDELTDGELQPIAHRTRARDVQCNWVYDAESSDEF